MTNEHYFSPQPSSASQPYVITVALPEGTLKLTTDRGVFSYGALDTGTRLLLLKAPAPSATGNLLDLGCGAGAIAISMAKRSPDAVVWAVDVNERAVALTRQNAEANNVSNVRACLPDDIPADVVFDTIWSNPPIHIGKGRLHDLLLRWLPRLSPTGHVTMVVQKHLGSDSLQTWLTNQGYPTERMASAKGFRLLSTTRATPNPS
jgi:16S rRNA (guanine1207-N2)-methyltransferase